MYKDIKEKFEGLYKANPLLVSAPGRINLIGEHTDYNNGFVLPAAIDKRIVFATAKNNLNKHRFYAYDIKEHVELPANQIEMCDKQWANYLLGVIAQIKKVDKTVSGIDCVFGGNIPLGAGLSSSAAMETGFAYSLNELFELGFSKIELVKMSQMAEHEYAGVKCGIMDQFASVFGLKGKVIQLDCQSLDYKHFPINLKGFDILLCDTQVKHSLASSEYNTRREECEKGVGIISQDHPNVKSLRDVSLDMLHSYQSKLAPIVYKRCKYVVEENQRLLKGCQALSEGKVEEFGELMFQTHAGLRDDYEVSCIELDILEEIARADSNVIGSRMMGGGFGGCTINIVKSEASEDFIETVTANYLMKSKRELKVYRVQIENGTSIIE